MNIENYDPDQLEELEQKTGSICANLKTIQEECPADDDLDELEAKLDRIIAKLKQVEEAEVA